MDQLRAFHGDPQLKAEFVGRMRAHIAADEVIQGTGYSDGFGCAVGCTYNEYDHALGPQRLGFPEWFEHLRDNIFEGLHKSEAAAWALASLRDVPVGFNIDSIKAPFLIDLNERNLARIKDAPEPYGQQCRDAIQGVIDWLKSSASEDAEKSAAEWVASAAASAARAARAALVAGSAWASAESAEWAALAAASAARAASASASAELAASAESAARAAWVAALAERAAGSAGSAERAEYQAQRDTLLALLTTKKD